MLCSPHSPHHGNSPFGVDEAGVVYLFVEARAHSFAHGVLKGRAKESREMLQARILGPARNGPDTVQSWISTVYARLKVGESSLGRDAFGFWLTFSTWADSDPARINRLASQASAQKIAGAVPLLADFLKETS